MEDLLQKLETSDSNRELSRPSLHEAEEAVRTLIRWIGDNPARSGLLDTPKRVLSGYTEMCSGYETNAEKILERTFEDTEQFGGIVLLKDIKFNSICEHHMLPIIGKADVAYIPKIRVVGISKIARVVEIFARRLQLQERMTSQIANSIFNHLNCSGVAVSIVASHDCMSARGIKKTNSTMQTTSMVGDFETDMALRNNFFTMISEQPLN